MENASKALIIAGIILIGVLLLALMVYFFTSASGLRSAYSNNINNTRITEFNTKFTKYNITKEQYKNSNGRDYVTIHDIVTLVNYAKEFNEGLDEESSEYIRVYIITEDLTWEGININEELKDNMGYKYVAIDNSIEYSSTTGRLTKIRFRKLNDSEIIENDK